MHPFHFCDVTVYGFHGFNIQVRNQILSGYKNFMTSTNVYDWLGAGVYFWENDFLRALDWAVKRYGEDAAVIGAKIDLGNCFDISNSYAKDILKISYGLMLEDLQDSHSSIPTNKPHPHGQGNPADMVLRNLDKAVIEYALVVADSLEPHTIYDTVRAPFQEGFPVYPGSAFREHDHIHLCVRNPNLLTNLFDPDKYID